MSEEESSIKGVWEGKVPICFVLDPSESASLSAPDPFFLMVYRRLYFPMVMERVIKHFESEVSSVDSSRIWLEFQGIPLKWHYPVGVLYDLCSTLSHLKGSVAILSITVRFKNFPTDELLFWPKVDDIEAHFMSSVKEADAIKHRGSVMNSLQKRDHQQLWSSLLGTDLQSFWRVNSKLMEPATGETECFRNIPITIHMLPVSYSDSAPSSICTRKLQFPLTTTLDNSSRPSTISDLLNETLRSMISCGRLPASAAEEAWHFVAHGIFVPPEAELLWLSQNMSYPDNFLHLILCPTSSD